MSKSLFVFVKGNDIRSRVKLLLVALLFIWAIALPLMPEIAGAQQITARSLTLGTAVPSAVTSYTFNFTVPQTTAVKSFSAQVCSAAIGTCTTPSGFTVTGSSISQPTGLGATTGWTISTATAGQLRMSNATNATASSGSQAVFFTSVTNPNAAYITSNGGAFYVRMTTYSDAAWTTAIDTGTVAAAVVQTLQVNAQVAESLTFCVGSTTVDSDSTGTVASDCSAVAGSSVNLGVLDSSKINITPMTTNCVPADCGKNGVAMVRSNALNGTVIYYDAVQQSGTNHKGTLRIAGQTCDASANNASTSNTDQCFNISTTQAAFTTANERFGMTVAGVNCGSTTSYTCTGTGTANLVRDAAYDGGGTSTYQATDLDQINGPTSNGYAWDESGTAVQIASSAASTIKQIDDEALILKFAAHPLITTPFGSYQAQADFIAVSTY